MGFADTVEQAILIPGVLTPTGAMPILGTSGTAPALSASGTMSILATGGGP